MRTQRLLDISISLITLMCFLPIFIPIIILLKFTGEGEVLYIQPRIGKNGKEFGLFKFATMLINSPTSGAGPITIKDDPRVLPVGKFLRKSKVNELPQLINVLLGHMSLVGPRPMTIDTFGIYPINIQNIINSVRPGLSGIGSIIFRDEEKIISSKLEPFNFYKKSIAPYKATVEIWFVNNNNLSTYLKVIFCTIWVVFRPESKLVWKTFPFVPKPPHNLQSELGFFRK